MVIKIYEPGETVIVENLVVENVGGMHTPAHPVDKTIH